MKILQVIDLSKSEGLEAHICANGYKAKIQELSPKPIGRIYSGGISEGGVDITPYEMIDWERVEQEEVVTLDIAPQAAALPFLGKILLSIAISAVVNWLTPKPDLSGSGFQRNPSPNNSLGQAENSVRLGGRIPDIYGRVTSTPDLIATPRRYFESHVEYEELNLCVGRGSYEIDPATIKDGSTKIQDMSRSTVKVFAPFSSASQNSTPQIEIGTEPTTPVYSVTTASDVIGQVLEAPNSQVTGNNAEVVFIHPNRIAIGGDDAEFDGIDEHYFTRFLVPDDEITISGASSIITPSGAENYNGTYTVTSVSDKEITVSTNFSGLSSGEETTENDDVVIKPVEGSYTEWFTIGDANTEKLSINLVAPQGLYKETNDGQSSFDVKVKVQTKPKGVGFLSALLSGDLTSTDYTIWGSRSTKSQRAKTITFDVSGSVDVRLIRITDTLYKSDFDGFLSDTVQVRDIYALEKINGNFGDVTTMQTKIAATNSALKSKPRKITAEVTRKIPLWDGTAFTGLTASRKASDIFMAMAIDEKIGRLSPSDLDIDGIIAESAKIEAHFGSNLFAEFGHTFDDTNTTFEDAANIVTGAVFSRPYMQGGVIKWRADLPQAIPKMAFNHRNTLPSSQSYSARFGNDTENDGVEAVYLDSLTGLHETLQYPADGSAIAPRTVQLTGVSHIEQAHSHMMREWQRMRNSRIVTEFTALDEASLLVLGDKILVENTVWKGATGGEIVDISGLNATLSQPHQFEAGKNYQIFLQLTNGTMQEMGVSAGSTDYGVILSQAPALPLITSLEYPIRTAYQIREIGDGSLLEFSVAEVTANDDGTYSVVAVNYDENNFNHDGETPLN